MGGHCTPIKKPYHGGHHGLRAGFDVCVSREMRLSQSFDNVNNATTVCVCELETGPHSTAALMQVCVNCKQDHTVQRRSSRRVPGGARLHDCVCSVGLRRMLLLSFDV